MISYFSVIILVSIFITYFAVYLFHKRKGSVRSLSFYLSIGLLIVGLPLLQGFYIFFGLGFILYSVLFYILHRKNYILPPLLSIFLAVAPILIIVSLSIYLESSKNKFIIPKNFEGRVIILHNCENGKSREWEDFFWRVYRIPDDGILKVNYSFAGNSFDHLHSKFYILEKDGSRTEIPYLDSDVNPRNSKDSKNEKFVYGLWTWDRMQKNLPGTPIDFIVSRADLGVTPEKIGNGDSYEELDKNRNSKIKEAILGCYRL